MAFYYKTPRNFFFRVDKIQTQGSYLSIYIINNKISGLIFNILCTKISSHKFLNSLKYPYLLVNKFQIKKHKQVKRVIYYY